MKKNKLIEIGIDTLSIFEPLSFTIKHLYESFTDDEIAHLTKEVEKIKSYLGLSKVHLNSNEERFIRLFLEKSYKMNRAIKYISIDYKDLFESLNIDKNSFEDILMNLESYDFIRQTKLIGGEGFIELEYPIFWNSNLLEIESGNSISFEHILVIVTKYLFDEHRHSKGVISSETIMKSTSLNEFLLNPILAYYEEYQIVNPLHTMGDVSIIYNAFILNKASLTKLNRKIVHD